MRVLVAEDEELLAGAIAQGLRQEGLSVDVCLDGREASERLAVSSYDVVVLDRDLPVVHGDDVCRLIVTDYPKTRVLMVTAATSVDDRVEGLRLGADDYLIKPFAFRELVARVLTLGRRIGRQTPPVVSWGEVRLDLLRHIAWCREETLSLSRNEFAVLEVLARAEGTVVSAEELLERVWDEEVDPFTNTVRVTVMRLRRKLGEPSPIVTVPGCGYRLTGGKP